MLRLLVILLSIQVWLIPSFLMHCLQIYAGDGDDKAYGNRDNDRIYGEEGKWKKIFPLWLWHSI